MLLFTVDNCPRCMQIKNLFDKTNMQYQAINGVVLFEGLHAAVGNIRVELSMKNWDKQFPVIVDGQNVYTYKEFCTKFNLPDLNNCENGSCRL